MALTIYGSPRSRTLRTLWLAAELGLDYAHEPLAWDDPALKEPDFLRINPMGTIPAIDDDGVALAESMAIGLYLAKKHGTAAGLYPSDPRLEAEVWRWSLWAQAHLEPWVQRDAAMSPLREAAPELLLEAARRSLAALDRALDGRDWLVGDGFTVADLNVAGVLSPSRLQQLDMTSFPHVSGWLARCYARPACVATRTRFAG